jgi:hypothetical protein
MVSSKPKTVSIVFRVELTAVAEPVIRQNENPAHEGGAPGNPLFQISRRHCLMRAPAYLTHSAGRKFRVLTATAPTPVPHAARRRGSRLAARKQIGGRSLSCALHQRTGLALPVGCTNSLVT